jgi:hypothetical protein
VSSSEEQGFEADQDVFSDPQAHFAAQYIHSAAAPEKGGRGRPRLTPSQLEQRAADKALSAAAKKPRGVKAGTGWTAARRAAFEAKKLLTGMPMQTQEQAAAVMQADIAPSLRQPKNKSKTGAGAIRLNPALSGSDQVSMLSQAGAAAATQPQSRGRSMEQMARGGGGGSSNDSFHSFNS